MSIYSEVMACEELLNQEYDAFTGEITEENEANMDIINSWKKDIIEQELGFKLIWDRLDNGKASRIKYNLKSHNYLR